MKQDQRRFSPRCGDGLPFNSGHSRAASNPVRSEFLTTFFSGVILVLFATASLAEASSSVIGWWPHVRAGAAVPPGLPDTKAIAAGQNFSLALTEEGQVVAWGQNSDGQTNVPAGLSNVVAIAAGGEHSLALTASGQVVGWGFNQFGQATPPSGLNNAVAIAAGYWHSLALTAEGRVIAWGDYRDGQTYSQHFEQRGSYCRGRFPQSCLNF